MSNKPKSIFEKSSDWINGKISRTKFVWNFFACTKFTKLCKVNAKHLKAQNHLKTSRPMKLNTDTQPSNKNASAILLASFHSSAFKVMMCWTKNPYNCMMNTKRLTQITHMMDPPVIILIILHNIFSNWERKLNGGIQWHEIGRIECEVFALFERNSSGIRRNILERRWKLTKEGER